MPMNDPGARLVYPAGSWFAPPVGMYRYWLEGGWRIQPALGAVRYRAEPFEGRGFPMVVPMVAAGRVRVIAEGALGGSVVRSLHESSHVRAPDQWASEMARWDRRDEAERLGFLMPAGRIAVGLFDERSAQYSALAAPVEVRAEREGQVTLHPPAAGRAGLVLEVRRFAFVVADDDVVLTLRLADGSTPEATLRSPNSRRIMSFWTDLPAGKAKLELRSKRWSVAPVEILLDSGRVTRTTVEPTDSRPDPRLPAAGPPVPAPPPAR